MINNRDKVIEEKTLEDYVKERMPLSAEEIYSIAANLCDALEKQNGSNLYNTFKELKPSNIIVTSARKVVLLDYEINKVHRVYDNKGYIYTSRQYNLYKLTKQSLMINIGMLIYFMATGKMAYTVLQPLMEEGYPQAVDENVKRIIKRCIQSDCEEIISIGMLKREIVIELLRICKHKNDIEIKRIDKREVQEIRVKTANTSFAKNLVGIFPKMAAAVFALCYSLYLKGKY